MIEQYKECTKCFIDRLLSEFYFRKDSNSYRNHCKTCVQKHNSIFKKEIVPWRKHFYSARRRCNNPKDSHYYLYGYRDIRFLLSMEEIKDIWFRDKAYNLNKPSIERIDVDGHYHINNCKFIELNEQSKNQRPRNGKHITQVSKNGEILNTFISIREAGRNTHIPPSNISGVINGYRKSAGGYIWRFENV